MINQQSRTFYIRIINFLKVFYSLCFAFCFCFHCFFFFFSFKLSNFTFSKMVKVRVNRSPFGKIKNLRPKTKRLRKKWAKHEEFAQFCSDLSIARQLCHGYIIHKQVPVVPGYLEPIDEETEIVRVVERIPEPPSPPPRGKRDRFLVDDDFDGLGQGLSIATCVGFTICAIITLIFVHYVIQHLF